MNVSYMSKNLNKILVTGFGCICIVYVSARACGDNIIELIIMIMTLVVILQSKETLAQIINIKYLEKNFYIHEPKNVINLVAQRVLGIPWKTHLLALVLI